MAKSVKFTINVNINGKNVIAEASTKSKELAVNLGAVNGTDSEAFKTKEVMSSLEKSLFKGKYDDMENGLYNALIDGGMKNLNDMVLPEDQAKELLTIVRKKTSKDITKWLIKFVSVSAITHCMVQEKAYSCRSIGFFSVSTCLGANPCISPAACSAATLRWC